MAFRPCSHVEQVAEHLREGLRQRLWTGHMPGALKLEQEVGASHTIIDRALRLLEKEGLLENLGPGRRRRITLAGGKPAALRIRILTYDNNRDANLNELLDQLHQAGHQASFAEKSMQDLGMDMNRITRFVSRIETDAWIVVAGWKDLLEWFVDQPTPAFALYGRFKDVNIAASGLRKLPAVNSLIQDLIGLGHQRIVGILREEHRKPQPNPLAQCMFDQLDAHGIASGSYNLPDWDDTPEDLQRLVHSLFKHTPPTALLIDEPKAFIAVRDHLARRGIHPPKQVSMVCFGGIPVFDWQLPPITHITWDGQKVVRWATRWVTQVAKGNHHTRIRLVDTEVIAGGTIGPVPDA